MNYNITLNRVRLRKLSRKILRGADSRGKANGILRRLEYYGWIEIETDKSYVQRVNFKEYSVRLMKTLLEIEEGKQIEYQGYIYTIYSLVRGTADNPGVVLLQILENTDLLITGLKNLNSNIKHYIDELTKHSTVAEIMDALFNDYITNIVDKAYHRLLTSDNVSKFRPEIIEAFRNMDDILNEINQKNTQYQRAAINRAKFLLSGSEDIRGQIKEILLGMNEMINEKKMELGGIYEIGFPDNLVRIYSCSFLDEKSLYSPIEGKKEFIPQQMDRKEPDMDLRQEKMRRMVEKMQKIMSPEKLTFMLERIWETEKKCWRQSCKTICPYLDTALRSARSSAWFF